MSVGVSLAVVVLEFGQCKSSSLLYTLCKWGRGGKTHTAVVQMLPKLHISMTSGRDMEVALHLVPLQTPIYPTGLQTIPPKATGRFLKFPFPFLPPDLSDNMFWMRVFFLFPLPSYISTVEGIHPLTVHPLIPVRAVFGQCVSS